MRRIQKQSFSIFATFLLLFTLLMPGATVAQGADTNGVLYEANPSLQQSKLSDRLLKGFEQEEQVTFLVKFKEKADTVQASSKAKEQAESQGLSAMKTELLQRSLVVNELKATAMDSQHRVLNFLEKDSSVADVEPYFIVNAVKVTATKEVAEKLAQFDEVEKVLPNEERELIVPVDEVANDDEKALMPSEDVYIDWNVERVKAPEAWEMGGNGNGTVVASIDTGVQWDHPALIEKYRGYNAETGEVDHAFSWFDATAGNSEPYDDQGHGTHVTGTMVGSEGENHIGVAPGAKWIAVKAFTGDTATDADLLEAAEWILAPTDAEGNQRVDLAPDIVNNSWGGGPGLDEWYRDVVTAWRNAEIFPVFAAGNVTTDNRGGPGSVATPANYPESFAVGALDIGDDLASFTLLGPSPYGEIKPDVSAPGQVIRSSIPGDGYAENSGTSMAAPAVSGVAALLRSVNGNLAVDELESILMETAKPLTDENYPESPNDGYGYGLVDAQAAILAIDEGVGTVQGTVIESETGNPLEAEIRIVGRDRSVMTNPDDGFYSIRYAAGEHAVAVEAYGYYTEEQTVNLTEDAVSAVDFSLEKIPFSTLTGSITDSETGDPVTGAVVMVVEDANVAPVRTDEEGTFSLTAYEGDYTLRISAKGYKPQKVAVSLDGENVDEAVELEPFYSYPGGELAYDDGTGEGGSWFLEAGNGWGVKMSLEEGKERALVTGGKFLFAPRGGTDFQVAVMDATGRDGAPGEVIAGPFDATADLSGEWTHVDLSEYGIMVEGDFYLVYLQSEDRENTPRLEQDKDDWTGRSWEMYKGYWYELESNFLTGNKMIRALVEYEIENPVITSPTPLSGLAESMVTVEGTASPTTTIKLEVNGGEATTVDVDDEGNFTADVELESGVNEVMATSLKDGKVVGVSEPVEVIYVSEEPMIATILPDEDQYVVAGDEVNVTVETNVLRGDASFTVNLPLNGTAQSASRVTMEEVEPGEYEGTFTIPVNMKLDGAVVDVRVVDRLGNTVEQQAAGKLYIAPDKIERISGDLRYDTAIEISGSGWNHADTVILAQGLEFADALSGVPLATQLDAPILLTQTNKLMDGVLAEITRLGAENVVVLGGTEAISEKIVKELEAADLDVRRISGENRFETAALIAEEVAPNGSEQVVVANGLDFPDALSVASHAAKAGLPILLSRQDALPEATVEALTDLNAQSSIVVGGASVLSAEIVASLPNAERVSGENRYETNIALANYFGVDAKEMFIATGRNYADALTGAVLAAKHNSALLLVRDRVPTAVTEFVQEKGVKRLTVFGGEEAVSTEVEAELRKIME